MSDHSKRQGTVGVFIACTHGEPWHADEQVRSSDLQEELLSTHQEAALQTGALDESQQHVAQLARTLAEAQGREAEQASKLDQMQKHISSAQAAAQEAQSREAEQASKLDQMQKQISSAQAAAQQAENAAQGVKAKWQAAEGNLQAEREALQVTLKTPVQSLCLCMSHNVAFGLNVETVPVHTPLTMCMALESSIACRTIAARTLRHSSLLQWHEHSLSMTLNVCVSRAA